MLEKRTVMEDFAKFHDEPFNPDNVDTLSVAFVLDERRRHLMLLNCGTKVLIQLEESHGFELLSPCCAELVEPDSEGLSEHSGFCTGCGVETRHNPGPLALEPTAINHVFLFTPELREWFITLLIDYLPPLDAVLASKPLESVVHAYIDAGAGKTSEFLRETIRGRVVDLYVHPFIGNRRA